MGVEFELKYSATPETLDRIHRTVVGQETVFHMQTTYYDTPSGDLAARRCTLRRRLENEKSICTLKTPASEGGRNEYETENASIEEAVSVLCKLSGFGALAGFAHTILPVCGARFTRIAKLLVLEECTVELALDRGVLTGGSKEMPLCEVEVELKSGSRAVAAAYAAQLAQTFGLTPEHRSKFARAKSLAGL